LGLTKQNRKQPSKPAHQKAHANRSANLPYPPIKSRKTKPTKNSYNSKHNNNHKTPKIKLTTLKKRKLAAQNPITQPTPKNKPKNKNVTKQAIQMRPTRIPSEASPTA
jgi:hypothetical protein